MLVPHSFDVTYDTLPDEPGQRDEALIGVFGQHVMWLLNTSFVRTAELVTSAESRHHLAGLFRKPYEAIAQYPPEIRDAAMSLVGAANRRVFQRFLWILTGQGFDDPLGPDHVIRFRLVMEICDADTGEVVEEAAINRIGKRSFSEYWGRWLNRYGKLGLTDPPPDGEATPPQPENGSEPTV